MKKLILGTALLGIALGVRAEMKQALTLHLGSGTEIVYFLDTEPEIEFRGQSMVVIVDSNVTDIPMSDVTRWEIGMAEYSSVEQITPSREATISVYGNCVRVHNPSLTRTVIYNINGQIAGTSEGQEAEFTLARGIYLVTIGDKSYKIAVQ